MQILRFAQDRWGERAIRIGMDFGVGGNITAVAAGLPVRVEVGRGGTAKHRPMVATARGARRIRRLLEPSDECLLPALYSSHLHADTYRRVWHR